MKSWMPFLVSREGRRMKAADVRYMYGHYVKRWSLAVGSWLCVALVADNGRQFQPIVMQTNRSNGKWKKLLRLHQPSGQWNSPESILLTVRASSISFRLTWLSDSSAESETIKKCSVFPHSITSSTNSYMQTNQIGKHKFITETVNSIPTN